MMKKALFFISKPLEMLAAIEAREQFNVGSTYLVIKAKKNDLETIQFLIQKSGNWSKVIYSKKKTSYGLSWVILLKKLKKIKFDLLFIRAFPIASYFIHNLKYKTFYLLDDGNATINISSEFKNKQNLKSRLSLFGLKDDKFKYRLITKIYTFLGIKIKNDVSRISFFTFYQLDEVLNQMVVINQMNWLCKLKYDNHLNELNNSVFIVGTNVCNAQIINEFDYFDYLKGLISHYPDKKVFYIPHKREKGCFLQKIQNNLNLEIRTTKFNLELDFLLNNEIPMNLVGSISTALLTMKFMYKNTIDVRFSKFNEVKINSEYKEELNRIYDFQSKYISPIS